MNSLIEIRETLTKALGSDALVSLVSTRIMLTTGVDLSQERGAEAGAESVNAESVNKVLTALKAMGYSTDALTLVAKRRVK